MLHVFEKRIVFQKNTICVFLFVFVFFRVFLCFLGGGFVFFRAGDSNKVPNTNLLL